MTYQISLHATGATEAEAAADLAAQCAEYLDRHPVKQLKVASAKKNAKQVAQPETPPVEVAPAEPPLTLEALRAMALELHSAGKADQVQIALSFWGKKLSDVPAAEYGELAEKFEVIRRGGRLITIQTEKV